MGGFKLYMLMARWVPGEPAWKKEYSDKAGWKGFLLRDTAYLNMVANKVVHSGFQLCTHAIGDSGNYQILRAYARAEGKEWPPLAYRTCTGTGSCRFPFLSTYSIIPSNCSPHTPPAICIGPKTVGPRTYLLTLTHTSNCQTNGWMPLGTDFPVEYIDPVKTFFAAVERRDAKRFPGGFQMDNALSGNRHSAAWRSGQPGPHWKEKAWKKVRPADFVILDTDLMTCEPKVDFKETRVLATYINGESVSK